MGGSASWAWFAATRTEGSRSSQPVVTISREADPESEAGSSDCS